MDINNLKLAYISAFGDLVALQRQEHDLSTAIGQGQMSKLQEMEQVLAAIQQLKQKVQHTKQQLVARGVNSGEINVLEERAKQEALVKSVKSSSLPPPPSPNVFEQKLLSAIDNEQFHAKHIQEVEEWNKQEKERQRILLEQQQQLAENQRLLELRSKQHMEEMQRREEELKQREKNLTEQEKLKLQAIEAELRNLENERKLLEEQRIQLDPTKQRKQLELEAEKANLLSTANSRGVPPPGNMPMNSMNSINNMPNPMGSQNFSNAGGMMNPSGSFMSNNLPNSNLNLSFQPMNNVQPQGQFPGNLTTQFNAPSNIAPGYTPSPFGSSYLPTTPIPPSAPVMNNMSGMPSVPLNQQLQQQFQSIVDINNPQSRQNPQLGMQMNPSASFSQPSMNQQSDAEKAYWEEQKKALQSQHSMSLQQMQAEHERKLREQEEALRKQWDSQYSVSDRNALNNLSDNLLKQMTEIELRNYMNNANLGRYLDEFLLRRQKLIEEEFWLKQQDMVNKQMALSFREDDLKTQEMLLQQQKEAEMRAKNRIFSIFVEKTGPDGRKTGEVLKLQVRAGDSIFRICERIGYDKELFKLKLQFNGMTLEDPDRSLMEFGIPDNAVLVTKLVPSISVDIMNLIPCEDCGKAFDAEVFAAHKCMKGYTQVLPSERKRGGGGGSSPSVSVTTRTVQMTKCNYCNTLYPSDKISSHKSSCSRRPRGYYY